MGDSGIRPGRPRARFTQPLEQHVVAGDTEPEALLDEAIERVCDVMMHLPLGAAAAAHEVVVRWVGPGQLVLRLTLLLDRSDEPSSC